tara:strand:+ start:3518 stop:4120 length:603 start_codon:yes stop_codon:yes gene_type:complete
MGMLKRAGDLVYTFRFLRLLTTPFEDTEAFKLGIIDGVGKRQKAFTLDNMEDRDNYRNYYTPFHRLVFNIKKIMAKAPGGSSRLASYATALYLLKEKFSIPTYKLDEATKEHFGVLESDFLSEQSGWFVLEDSRLTQGIYKVLGEKLLNDTLDEMVSARDKIRVDEDCYPVGKMFGINIYEAVHIRTNKKIYISVGELAR